MNRRPRGWPPSIIALLGVIGAGCVTNDLDVTTDPALPVQESEDAPTEPPDPSAPPDPGAPPEPTTTPGEPPADTGDVTYQPPPATACPPSADTYTPYSTDAHPTASASVVTWHGAATAYPASVEDFRGYGTAMPATVECSNAKGTRSHLDVTAGCLQAVTGERGQIVSTDAGAFRALALGYTATDTTHVVRWTDQSIEYAFFYTGTSGAGVLPGFKAFARYNTEDDLYVASWRTDGVAQIQRKQCGQYTALKVLKTFGAPSPNTWHTIRFDAIGNQLALYLDGQQVITVTDTAFASGTAGIRTDAMTGALIDNWRVGGI